MIAAPATASTRPRSCGGRSGSCSRTTAVVTANSGARLPSVEVMTGPSARLEAKVSSVSEAGKNRPMAMNMGRPRQTTGSPEDQRRQQQEQKREGGDADRGPRQRLDGPQAQLRQNDPAPRKKAEAKAKMMAAVMRSVLVPSWGRGLLVPAIFARRGALPIRFRRFSTPPDAHHSGSCAEGWRPGHPRLLRFASGTWMAGTSGEGLGSPAMTGRTRNDHGDP